MACMGILQWIAFAYATSSRGQQVPDLWDAAYSQAQETLARMKDEEKQVLLHGSHGTYVGNTPGIPRLKIPPLNMQDASSGFRPLGNGMVGSVTVWPSLLALAATWNPDLVRKYAEGVGREFKGKGANVLLGPGINVHRLARGGRNFEYLSGEDPYLGSKLVGPYVKGVQSQGLIAVMKHWIFNEQETHRAHENSIVDDKTAWELYYPPFRAAVEAGVSATMCSYNKYSNVYACENEKTYKVLKDTLGFRGFVMSDWGATHSNESWGRGLDQEMPYTDSFKWAKLSSKVVNDAAIRILAAMYRVNASIMEGADYNNKVTTAAHVATARSIAASSIVLLKNKEDLLPLSRDKVKTIAIIGAAAVANAYDPNGQSHWEWGDIYSGGGSGHMAASPQQLIKPLHGISKHAEKLGIKVIESATDNITAAQEAAAKADVAIVVAGCTSSESYDRAHLHLDGKANDLIAAVAANNTRTVAVLQIPGAVLMPWRESVSSILTMFLGGQETGSAWADVLFGDHAPSGHLPIMMPVSEKDTIAPSDGNEPRCVYSEGMATSYRNKDFKAAYPFGHGLTYTTFAYIHARVVTCPWDVCIRVILRNTGKRPGVALPQLYLQFPGEAKHPAPLLKGFMNTGKIEPGAEEELVFVLTDRDLSYFDDQKGMFVRPKAGSFFRAHIGPSSADFQQHVSFSFGKMPESNAEPVNHTSLSQGTSTSKKTPAISTKPPAIKRSHHAEPEIIDPVGADGKPTRDAKVSLISGESEPRSSHGSSSHILQASSVRHDSGGTGKIRQHDKSHARSHGNVKKLFARFLEHDVLADPLLAGGASFAVLLASFLSCYCMRKKRASHELVLVAEDSGMGAIESIQPAQDSKEIEPEELELENIVHS